jgi:hypothetical protein
MIALNLLGGHGKFGVLCTTRLTEPGVQVVGLLYVADVASCIPRRCPRLLPGTHTGHTSKLGVG